MNIPRSLKGEVLTHNSNLIKVVVLAQYWEVGIRWCFSIHWGNITTLMRFDLWLTLLLSLVYSFEHEYWIHYVRQGVRGSSTSVEYSFSAENHQFDTISVHNSNNYLNTCDFWNVLILSLMCAHSSMTQRINLIFTQKLVNKCRNTPVKLFCSKPFSLKSYTILIRGDLLFWLCLVAKILSLI